MRQTFTAKIRHFERKRYFKSSGFPYSYILLVDLASPDGSVPCIDNIAYLKYGQGLHLLNVSKNDCIEFSAELDTSNSYRTYLRNARGFRKVDFVVKP